MSDTVVRQRTNMSSGTTGSFTEIPPTTRRGGGRTSALRNAVRNLEEGQYFQTDVSHPGGWEKALGNIRSNVASIENLVFKTRVVRHGEPINADACTVRVYRMPAEPTPTSETPTNA